MTPLQSEPLNQWSGRRRQHALLQDFSLIIVSQGMTNQVTVPKGFITDWATVPLFCQLILGNRDDYAEAACLHDYLCVTNVPYFVANSWMRSAMFALGAPRWKRVAFFYALMIFGYDSSASRGIAKAKNYIAKWRRPTDAS
jgi:hypothetical protein